MTKRQMLKEFQNATDGIDILDVINIEEANDDIERLELPYIELIIGQNLSIEGSN